VQGIEDGRGVKGLSTIIYTMQHSNRQHIKCPFCAAGHILPKAGSTGCPMCFAKVWLDDRLECIFVDKRPLRLPLHGTVCPIFGLVQSEEYDKMRVFWCGVVRCSSMR